MCTSRLVTLMLLPVACGFASGWHEKARGENEEDLYRLVSAAQVSNFSNLAYRQGRIRFNAEYQPPPIPGPAVKRFEPVVVRGEVLFSGDDARWVYRARDPDKFALGEEARAPIEECSPQYGMVLKKDMRYMYNSKTNTLQIRKTKGTFTLDFLLHVMPSTHWFLCCPPDHFRGRPWGEMVGPSSPVIRPGDSVTIAREGRLVRQARLLANGAKSITTFSLDWEGNVVRQEFIPSQNSSQGSVTTYEWRRDARGTCVLSRCSSQKFERGGQKVESQYELSIESVDLVTKVKEYELTLPGLLSLLPRDVLVDDQVNRKRYYPNPQSQAPTNKLNSLAEELKREGFLGKE